MKRLIGLVLAAGLLAMLGGCVYQPYRAPSVVYDDGTVVGGGAVVGDDGYGGYGYAYAPAYYAGYYNPWCCYAGPWIGIGFYGSYYYGHGHYHGPYNGGWYGGSHGGGWHGGGGGHWHGH